MRCNLRFGNAKKDVKEKPLVLRFRQRSAQKKDDVLQTAVPIIRLGFFQQLLFRTQRK